MTEAELFVDYSDRKLGEVVKTMTLCLERLTEEQIWHRGGAHENSVGNLVLHLCGNLQQWVIHGIGGKPDVRMRDAEFQTQGGIGRVELVARFNGTVSQAREVIRSMPEGRLLEIIKPQFGEVPVLEAIYRIVGHAQEHLGQVILLVKQMGREDLDLTIPRPR